MVSILKIAFTLSYVVSAVISLMINSKIRNLRDGETLATNEKLRKQVIDFTYIKTGIIVFRIFFLSRLSLGGASVSNTLNVVSLFILMGIAPANVLQDLINLFLPEENQLNVNLDSAIVKINEFDFWVSIIGLINVVIALPGFVNWILVISIFVNQIVNGYDLPTP